MDILTGTILKIIEYTVEPIGRQVGYLINYKSNLESLRSQLKNLDDAKDRMKHRVDEAERKGERVHNDVQNWRKEADGITQEAENILGNEGQAKTKCFRGVCPNLVSYHQFSRKSAKLAKKFEFHAKKEFPSVSYEAPVEDIRAIPSQEYIAFESRTSMLKQIMEELKNPDTNMIGVYGLGGVGKTTLAEEVFRQVNKEEKLFDDVVLILNVKGKKDMEIQKEIAEQLRMEVKDQSMEARANCLWHRIKDTKTLVILDDVLGKIDLKAVGLVVGRTCNLLLTSRDKEVLFYEMRTQKNLTLDLLCEQESLSLFEKRAGAVIKNDRIQEVANELAKKCGGLPILVVAVASGLRESSLEEWKDTLRRFKYFEEKGSTGKSFEIIEWSYNRLHSEELKRLFLLCGIMLQSDCVCSLSDLLKYTIGLGLFKNVRTLEEARNALHASVKKLKDSCLLLDGYADVRTLVEARNALHASVKKLKDSCLLLGGYADGSVRMHDVVRDVAVKIAFRDHHVLSKADTELDESPRPDCSLISLERCTIPKLPDVPWECPELNFFYLGSSDKSLEIPGNFFEGMNELKVLDVTRLRIPSLPPSLQSLTNLQTLCLNMCVLGDIALVGQLTNLKILSLLESKVKELPEEIGQLTRLQLLDLTDCYELVVIPSGVISSLTSLEDLRMGSFKEWEGGLNDGRSNASVSELKQLRQLTALEIHIPDAKLLPANMFSDTKLERYTVLIGDCWQYPYHYRTSSIRLKLKLTTNSQFDQGIKLLLERCEHLELDGMEAANIISYILASDSGKQLKNLRVQNSDEVTAVINSSHAFPKLESLSLNNLVNLETVCCGQLRAQPFPKLRYLTLWNLPKLIGLSSKGSTSVVSTEAEEIILENEIGGPIMNGEVLMPNLTHLFLNECDGLRFLFSYSMAKSLEQLEHIEISKCQMMEEIVSTSGYNQEHTNNMFCNLKDLKLQHLPSITRFCSGSYLEFSLLETLRIEDCPRLGTFIFDRKSEITSMGKENDDRNSKENLETVIPHFLFDEKVGFPSLENLMILGLPVLRTIWHNKLAPNSFCKLKKVEVLRCNTLINIFTPLNGEVLMPNLTSLVVHGCGGLRFLFSSSMARSLVQLKSLMIFDCQIMEEIVSTNESSEEDTDHNMFSQLQNLNLLYLPNLTRFCSARRSINFHSLEALCLDRCSKLETFIFDPMSTNITINKATEEIRDSTENIGTDARYFLFDEKVGFPSLESLVIRGLPVLRTIWHNRLAPNSFCKLKEVEVSGCDTLINIFAPSMMGRLNALDTLKIQECKSLQAVFEQTYDTSTTKLFMNGEGNPFPSLETLCLDTEIWYEAHDPLPVELFINLIAIQFINLKAIQFSCAHPQSFHFLQKLHNLEKLDVCGGPWKEIFVYEGTSSGEIDAVGKTLPHIKNLSLKKMKELMHLGNDNSELIFPNLEILNVWYCGRLKNLTSSTISFHNLTTLHVNGCMGLKYLVTYSVAKCLHQLKTLEVRFCESITEIVASNGDEEDSGNYYEIAFSSLQHLYFSNLPSLRGFCSSGNCTVRVPSLNSLSLYGCRIELKISPDGSLIQSGSRPERQQITEEVEEKEEDDANETGGKQLIAHTN